MFLKSIDKVFVGISYAVDFFFKVLGFALMFLALPFCVVFDHLLHPVCSLAVRTQVYWEDLKDFWRNGKL